jgi:uncharacterized protein
MISLTEMQEVISRQLEEDKKIRSIEATGDTLEEAVANAALELRISVRRVEFETLERGSSGFIGVGRKEWKIRAYESVKQEKPVARTSTSLEDLEKEATLIPIQVDKDGEVFVRLFNDGVFLKVTSPLGKGKRIQDKTAIDRLHARAVNDFDEGLVSRIVKQAEGEYIRVGEFIGNPANDSNLMIDIADQEMRAFLKISHPGPGGTDLSAAGMIAFLHNNRVIHGIKEEVIRDLEDKPRYNEAVLVAEGTKPVHGRDARMVFNFETDQSKIKLRETNGKVNFKELNIVQNVVEGQLLAKRVSAEKGVPGKTVTGKLLPAENGRDMAIVPGKNTHISDDGSSLVADINGQVLVVNGKVNVEPIYTVQGDVNLHTGNVTFLGTVIISGNVEDGFAVKATGNIEIRGSVGKADLEAEGNIIVDQGISGKNGGTVKSGGSVWARFIQNASVEADGLVVVSEGIINSNVDSNRKVICQGKRAYIIGGRIRAAEEINAKILGSQGGGAGTVLEAGYDPKSKERMDRLVVQFEQLKKQLDDYSLNIQTLLNIKRQRRTLPEDKMAMLQELQEKKHQLEVEGANSGKEIEKLKGYLENLKIRGKICASSKVFPGVEVVIRDIKLTVNNEYKAVTFILENNVIRVTKYEEVEEDLKKGPNGYTTH